MCRCVDQSITMSVHRGAGCMYVCTNYTIINISFLHFLPPQTIAVYYLLIYSLAPFTNVLTSACALPVFMPRPEIIYINTPFSLPRPEVIYIWAWLISAPNGVSAYNVLSHFHLPT